MKGIDYKFNEDNLLSGITDYIDATYKQHYAGNGKIQVTEYIMSNCENIDFLRGNVLKYICRYGHKDGKNRKDLFKAIHYIILMMSYEDQK